MNILIVDDEPGLAAGLAGWLKEIGRGSPGVATTSDQAIDWINRHGVDVLVCDVAIKPADGLRCERPSSRISPQCALFLFRAMISRTIARAWQRVSFCQSR